MAGFLGSALPAGWTSIELPNTELDAQLRDQVFFLRDETSILCFENERDTILDIIQSLDPSGVYVSAATTKLEYTVGGRTLNEKLCKAYNILTHPKLAQTAFSKGLLRELVTNYTLTEHQLKSIIADCPGARFNNFENQLLNAGVSKQDLLSTPDGFVYVSRVGAVYGRYQAIAREISKKYQIGVVVTTNSNSPPSTNLKSLEIIVGKPPSVPGDLADNSRYPLKKVKIGSTLVDVPGETIHSPTGQGTILKNEDGVPIAEILPKQIYLLFGLGLAAFPGSVEIVKWFFTTVGVVDQALNPELKIKKPKSILGITSTEANKAVFQEILGRGLNTKLREYEQQVKDYTAQSDNALRMFQDAEGKKLSTQKLVDAIKSGTPNDQKKVDTIFSDISSIPEIEEIKFSKDCIEFITKELKIDDTYPGGVFRVKIPLIEPLDVRRIQITNLTKRRAYNGNNWDHPHVPESRPCWGASEVGLAKLLTRYEISDVLQVIVRYLQTYNPKDVYGNHIEMWKAAS